MLGKVESAFEQLAKATGTMSLMLSKRKLTKRDLLLIQQQVNAAKEAVDDLIQVVAP